MDKWLVWVAAAFSVGVWAGPLPQTDLAQNKPSDQQQAAVEGQFQQFQNSPNAPGQASNVGAGFFGNFQGSQRPTTTQFQQPLGSQGSPLVFSSHQNTNLGGFFPAQGGGGSVEVVRVVHPSLTEGVGSLEELGISPAAFITSGGNTFGNPTLQGNFGGSSAEFGIGTSNFGNNAFGAPTFSHGSFGNQNFGNNGFNTQAFGNAGFSGSGFGSSNFGHGGFGGSNFLHRFGNPNIGKGFNVVPFAQGHFGGNTFFPVDSTPAQFRTSSFQQNDFGNGGFFQNVPSQQTRVILHSVPVVVSIFNRTHASLGLHNQIQNEPNNSHIAGQFSQSEGKNTAGTRGFIQDGGRNTAGTGGFIQGGGASSVEAEGFRQGGGLSNQNHIIMTLNTAGELMANFNAHRGNLDTPVSIPEVEQKTETLSVFQAEALPKPAALVGASIIESDSISINRAGVAVGKETVSPNLIQIADVTKTTTTAEQSSVPAINKKATTISSTSDVSSSSNIAFKQDSLSSSNAASTQAGDLSVFVSESSSTAAATGKSSASHDQMAIQEEQTLGTHTRNQVSGQETLPIPEALASFAALGTPTLSTRISMAEMIKSLSKMQSSTSAKTTASVSNSASVEITTIRPQIAGLRIIPTTPASPSSPTVDISSKAISSNTDMIMSKQTSSQPADPATVTQLVVRPVSNQNGASNQNLAEEGVVTVGAGTSVGREMRIGDPVSIIPNIVKGQVKPLQPTSSSLSQSVAQGTGLNQQSKSQSFTEGLTEQVHKATAQLGIPQVLGAVTSPTQSGISQASGGATSSTQSGISQASGGATSSTQAGIPQVSGGTFSSRQSGIAQISGRTSSSRQSGISQISGGTSSSRQSGISQASRGGTSSTQSGISQVAGSTTLTTQTGNSQALRGSPSSTQLGESISSTQSSTASSSPVFNTVQSAVVTGKPILSNTQTAVQSNIASANAHLPQITPNIRVGSPAIRFGGRTSLSSLSQAIQSTPAPFNIPLSSTPSPTIVITTSPSFDASTSNQQLLSSTGNQNVNPPISSNLELTQGSGVSKIVVNQEQLATQPVIIVENQFAKESNMQSQQTGFPATFKDSQVTKLSQNMPQEGSPVSLVEILSKRLGQVATENAESTIGSLKISQGSASALAQNNNGRIVTNESPGTHTSDSDIKVGDTTLSSQISENSGIQIVSLGTSGSGGSITTQVPTIISSTPKISVSSLQSQTVGASLSDQLQSSIQSITTSSSKVNKVSGSQDVQGSNGILLGQSAVIPPNSVIPDILDTSSTSSTVQPLTSSISSASSLSSDQQLAPSLTGTTFSSRRLSTTSTSKSPQTSLGQTSSKDIVSSSKGKIQASGNSGAIPSAKLQDSLGSAGSAGQQSASGLSSSFFSAGQQTFSTDSGTSQSVGQNSGSGGLGSSSFSTGQQQVSRGSSSSSSGMQGLISSGSESSSLSTGQPAFSTSSDASVAVGQHVAPSSSISSSIAGQQHASGSLSVSSSSAGQHANSGTSTTGQQSVSSGLGISSVVRQQSASGDSGAFSAEQQPHQSSGNSDINAIPNFAGNPNIVLAIPLSLLAQTIRNSAESGTAANSNSQGTDAAGQTSNVFQNFSFTTDPQEVLRLIRNGQASTAAGSGSLNTNAFGSSFDSSRNHKNNPSSNFQGNSQISTVGQQFQETAASRQQLTITSASDSQSPMNANTQRSSASETMNQHTAGTTSRPRVVSVVSPSGSLTFLPDTLAQVSSKLGFGIPLPPPPIPALPGNKGDGAAKTSVTTKTETGSKLGNVLKRESPHLL